MRIGASLALFTVGAILGLAVHVDNSVINVNLIGLILMLVAIVGFALSPAALSIQRRITTTTAKPSDGTGTTEVQETVEEEDGPAIDHPKWAARTAAAPRVAGGAPRAPQRAERSWPSAG
jgi:phosphate/sulfate permease